MAITFDPADIELAGRTALLGKQLDISVEKFRACRTELVRLTGLMDSVGTAPTDWDQRLQDLAQELRRRYTKILEVRAAIAAL